MDNISLDLAVEFFITAKEADGRAPRTISDYHRCLDPLLAWCAAKSITLATLTRNDVRRYVSSLRARGWSDGTVGIHVRNIRCFLRWIWNEGMKDENLATCLESPRTVRRQDSVLTPAQIEALLDACSGDEYAIRDRAIILMFLDTGVRSGEMAGLRRSNLHINGDGTGWMSVYGSKSRKWRFVFVGERTTQAMVSYLEQRDDDHNALWMGRYGKPLAREGIYRIVTRRGDDAGVQVYPHLLRKTFATLWLDNGGDPERLRVLAGWTPASISDMLRVYVESGRENLARAHRDAGPVDNLA
jgi:site-specific recombinase XerD